MCLCGYSSLSSNYYQSTSSPVPQYTYYRQSIAPTSSSFLLSSRYLYSFFFFFFSSRRRHTRLQGDWSSDVCSSDLRGILYFAVFFLFLRVLEGNNDSYEEKQYYSNGESNACSTGECIARATQKDRKSVV